MKRRSLLFAGAAFLAGLAVQAQISQAQQV
jgi:hypothetical protein